jgi:hypothetical protein
LRSRATRHAWRTTAEGQRSPRCPFHCCAPHSKNPGFLTPFHAIKTKRIPSPAPDSEAASHLGKFRAISRTRGTP